MYGIPLSHFQCNLNPILRTPHYSGLRTADLGNLGPEPHLLRTVDKKLEAIFKVCITACLL